MAKQRTGDIELIEVFASDDVPPWIDVRPFVAEPSAVASGRRRSRRGGVFLALVAIIAGVAGAVALDDDITRESAITPMRGVSASDSSSIHYLIDDDTLIPYAADIVTPPASGQQVQVWTTGVPTDPTVVIELHPYPYRPYGIVGATRDVVDGIEIVRPAAQPATVISEVAIDDAHSITVTATDLHDADVARIVRDVTVFSGELVDESGVMEELGLDLTFEDESLDDLIFGRVESEVRYLNANGEITTLRSAVGSSEHRLEALQFLITDPKPFFFSSSGGHLPNGDAIVVWDDDGGLLSLVAPAKPGDLIADDLIRMSREVRRATDSEWVDMMYGLRPDYTLGDFETLATGHASNTELWRAGPQLAERGGRTQFLWWWTVPGLDDVTASTAASLYVGTRPRFDTVVVPGATFVFVSQRGEGGTVTVRTATGAEFVAELIRPFEQSEVWMTVVHIEEPGPVTVQVNSYGVMQSP